MKYNNFVNPDAVVQQLLLLDEGEMTIPITDDNNFHSAINLVSIADACTSALWDDDTLDPSNVSEAKHSKYWSEWLTAMYEELASLKAKGIYEEVDVIPPNHKPVQWKWVLHIKHDKTGTIS